MILRKKEAGYPGALARRNWVTWAWATVIALAMNLMLFVIMPNLLQRNAVRPAYEPVVSQIHMIRIKRPDSEVHRKTQKAPEVVQKQDPLKPLPTVQQPVMTKLSLPFEINPRLPSGPTTLNLPPMETVGVAAPSQGFDTPDVKGVYEVGDLDNPLTVITRVPPDYPLSAKRRGIQGEVKVRFIVNEQGAVENITIVTASPAGIFDQSVIRCVSKWRFKAGTVEGRPVKALAETTVKFELE
ncbi:MAG: energy transducer TonB [Pseudomonadota bacterium]